MFGGHQAEIGHQLSRIGEASKVSDLGHHGDRNASDQGGGQGRTDTGDLIEPSARLIGSVPGHDPTVKL
jgi:hypothetical protein